jgi:hypothetical protein
MGRWAVVPLVVAGVIAALVVMSVVLVQDRLAVLDAAQAPATTAPTTTQSTVTTTTTVPPLVPAPAVIPPPPLPDPGALGDTARRAVTAVARGGDVGVLVLDLKSGATLAEANADRSYYTASVVKLLIAVDTLYRAGWDTQNAVTRKNIVDMLALSHDGIAENLWVRNGSTAAVPEVSKLAGLTQTRAPRVRDQWEMTGMSPRDVARLYHYVVDHMPDAAAAVVLDGLGSAKSRAADGFPQFFGIPDGLPGQRWAIKQGWMEIDNGLVLNTTGLVNDRYVVVVLAKLPGSTSFATARTALTAGVQALAKALPLL